MKDYDVTAARGFIDLFGLPMKVRGLKQGDTGANGGRGTAKKAAGARQAPLAARTAEARVPVDRDHVRRRPARPRLPRRPRARSRAAARPLHRRGPAGRRPAARAPPLHDPLDPRQRGRPRRAARAGRRRPRRPAGSPALRRRARDHRRDRRLPFPPRLPGDRRAAAGRRTRARSSPPRRRATRSSSSRRSPRPTTSAASCATRRRSARPACCSIPRRSIRCIARRCGRRWAPRWWCRGRASSRGPTPWPASAPPASSSPR